MVEILTAHDTSIINDQDTNSCPFEGPEKLLEIWFTPDPSGDDRDLSATEKLNAPVRTGLRTVPRDVWEAMLDIVKCKVLSVVNGSETDAYLLSESSLFVFPHKLILKTCGTTLNLLGLPRILAIAKEHCGFDTVWRCFYSRKSFMFPERQDGPHKEWRNEIEYLDSIFENGCAYTVGRVNGDHWLLYMTNPPSTFPLDSPTTPDDSDLEHSPRSASPSSDGTNYLSEPNAMTSSITSLAPSFASSATLATLLARQDYTIEILMTKLSAKARRPFFFLEEDLRVPADHKDMSGDDILDASCAAKGAFVSSKLGIDAIFPKSRTALDSYAFEPCGYSANALIDAGEDHGGEGYYTIHVTPEEGWSYASFECNVPVKISTHSTSSSRRNSVGAGLEDAMAMTKLSCDETNVASQENKKKGVKANGKEEAMPDLETLVQRVVDIFQPSQLTLTLFVSQTPTTTEFEDEQQVGGDPHKSHTAMLDAPATVEIAQRVFRHALTRRGYARTDKTNYEFGGYDLAFATFTK